MKVKSSVYHLLSMLSCVTNEPEKEKRAREKGKLH